MSHNFSFKTNMPTGVARLFFRVAVATPVDPHAMNLKCSNETLGVSQWRGGLLGSTCTSESVASEARQESFPALENEELWNRITGVQVCVICEAPP